MIARVHSSILTGIDAIACEVEVDVSAGGIGELKLVGLAETAVKESVSRIQAALRNSGYRWPGPKVTINLAPADVKKDSAAYDLPIAVAAMIAGGLFDPTRIDEYLLVGELALDGRVRAIRGALATAMLARQLGKRGLIVPADNAAEAAVVEAVEVIPVGQLADAVAFLSGQAEIAPARVDLNDVFAVGGKYDLDFADVRGQESAKRAITIAASGHHNLLMIGPPGTGKTMLAKRIPTILPPLTPEESLETTRIYSARGLLAPGQALIATRPVRMPHHSTSSAALVGGGMIPQPGEISLAHHGVLFLDELPEFNRITLEMIRQPLEDRCVTIPRVHSTMKFPASIMLVAAMNPCPCGYFTDPKRPCKCSPFVIERYLARISGPLIDRIDIHIEVPPVQWRQLRAEGPAADGLSSAAMREAVLRAREIQRRRFAPASSQEPVAGSQSDKNDSHPAASAPADSPAGADGWLLGGGPNRPAVPSSMVNGQLSTRPQGMVNGPQAAPPSQISNLQSEISNRRLTMEARSTTTNASMSSRQVRQFCRLDAAGEAILKQAMTELGLSARAHDKVLRIARTIADLEASDRIQPHHMAEAIQYRRLDRKL